jgi:hypothetical protein
MVKITQAENLESGFRALENEAKRLDQEILEPIDAFLADQLSHYGSLTGHAATAEK